MSDESDANAWLAWARELQALGQTGLHFAQDPYDRDRYGRLIGIAAAMVRRIPFQNRQTEHGHFDL